MTGDCVVATLLSIIVLTMDRNAICRILLFLRAPSGIVSLAVLCLQLVFTKVPVVTTCGVFTTVLQTLKGDESPLVTVAITTIVGIKLSLLFITIFN